MTTAADTATLRAPKAKRAKSVKTDKPKDGRTVKATIVMDVKLHCLLSSIAPFLGLNCSELAVDLIERGLKERHEAMYNALDGFKPKVRKQAKPASSVVDNDSADTDGGVSRIVEAAA
jgi:hypothetical protein